MEKGRAGQSSGITFGLDLTCIHVGQDISYGNHHGHGIIALQYHPSFVLAEPCLHYKAGCSTSAAILKDCSHHARALTDASVDQRVYRRKVDFLTRVQTSSYWSSSATGIVVVAGLAAEVEVEADLVLVAEVPVEVTRLTTLLTTPPTVVELRW